MPAKYSSEDHERALERLRANRWSFARTSEELGLSRQTPYNLMQLDKSEESSLSNLSNVSNMSTIRPTTLISADAGVLERLLKMTEKICTTWPNILLKPALINGTAP